MKFLFKILFSVLLFACGDTYAQNLVPNPSFEIISSCPTNGSQIDKAIGWMPFTSSPDLIHGCYAPNWPCAATGISYVNVYCSLIPASYNEVFGIELTVPLVIGSKYYVNFKVREQGWSSCFMNKLGARFSTRAYCYSLDNYTNLCDSTSAPIENIAHVYTNEIIDTNWTSVFGSFIADSAYKYIMLGHLFDTTNTDYSTIFCPNGMIGYLFDDICVSADSLTCENVKAQVIDFNANPSIVQVGSCIDFSIYTTVQYYSAYDWYFPGGIPSFSTDNNPSNICYDSAGTFDVMLIAYDSLHIIGCTDTLIKNNYITVDTTNDVELNEANPVYISPNPADKFLKISGNQSILIYFNVSIFDILGKIVYSGNNISEKINVQDLQNGIYFLKIQNNNHIFVHKLIINHK